MHPSFRTLRVFWFDAGYPASMALLRTSMDLYKAIQDLYAEKEKLERVIASLEDLQRAAGGGIPPVPGAGKRRGRKSMGADERQEVSDRMKRYWASRRKPGEEDPESSGNTAGR